MSSYITSLLDGADVQWKPLIEVCDFKNGFAFKSSLFKENGLPIVRIANINANTIDLTDVKYFNAADYQENIELYEIINNDILITMSGTIKVGCYNYQHSAYLNQRVGKLLPKKEILNNRYLYHYLLANVATISKLAAGGVVANLSSKLFMSKMCIPIPCSENPQKSLKIQTQIASILDLFSSLGSQLHTELNARKKQYSYYRERLFEKIPATWQALGDVGSFLCGKGLQKQDFIEEGVPAIHYGQLHTRYAVAADKTFTYVAAELASKLKKAQRNDLLLASTSENDEDLLKPLAWLGGQVVISGDMMIFRHRQNVKYLAYFFQTAAFQIQKRKYIKGSKVRRISSSDLAKIFIPIPYADNLKKSLAAQQHMVVTLDKFDTLCNSNSEGLPYEIMLQQRQYQYYRNLLFCFPQTQGQPKKRGQADTCPFKMCR